MSANYSSCIYRSKDPVRNFKIKVILQRATGKTPYAQNEAETKSSELAQIKSNIIDLHSKREEVIVNWQTKIFSKREYLRYSNDNFEPKTILEDHYKEECLKLKERSYQPGRIFTYIDSDPFEFYDEIEAEVTQAPNTAIPSYLQKVQSNLKKRRPLVGKTKPSEVTIPKKNIVNYSPTKEESSRFKTKIVPFHTMYIMADLSTAENTFTMNDEVVLCCIKIDSNGAIVMKPDFSKDSYFIQTGGFARETYEYFLEHVSSGITTDDLLREQRLHKELYLRHSQYIKNLVGTEFKMPVIGVMKVHIFGEIISAKNFDYDDLHVYYQLDLPKNWHIDRSVPLSGFTPTSRTKVEGDDEVAYFSHPFEFDLYYKNDEFNPLNHDELPKMPKILFEVASYDSWNRYRTEGYTWTQIPVKPGMYTESKPCWRPRGDSLIYELRRFFIGGSPELEDITYTAIPSDHEGSILSKFGFRTFTTGTLNIRLNTVFQSQIFLKRSKKTSGLIDNLANFSSVNDLIAILEGFNLAKNKMIEARENSKVLLE
ncbi:unnamed protein product [Brachionus calyciflorus]|uniref:Meckel syndrome type 1 protein n=1 Tax=Brachionus calyciflorus TaxID=104777 RepID=A0A813NI58_9BILA|nr:unnamed protein product [Brachionus calyciflorus]